MYSVEEVAGTLFLKYDNLVLAANIGEEGMISDEVREHFRKIVETMNQGQLNEEKADEEG